MIISLLMWEILMFTLFADKNIIIQPILLFLQLFGLQTYLYHEQSDISFLIKNIGIKTGSILNKDKEQGLIFGKWFLGYIYMTEDEKTNRNLYIIMSKNKYKELQKKKMDKFKLNDTKEEKKIMLVSTYDKYGTKWWPQYSETEINYSFLKNRPEQKSIVDEIIEQYKKSINNSYVAFIHGENGSGKSTIGYLIARSFQSSYTDEWNPMAEGDNIINIINEVQPTKEKPLVIALDEVDKMILKLDTLKPYKDCPRQIEGKASWNRFFDKVEKGRYPNVILILTSNISPLDKNDTGKMIIDPALIRAGRINKKYMMNKKKIN